MFRCTFSAWICPSLSEHIIKYSDVHFHNRHRQSSIRTDVIHPLKYVGNKTHESIVHLQTHLIKLFDIHIEKSTVLFFCSSGQSHRKRAAVGACQHVSRPAFIRIYLVSVRLVCLCVHISWRVCQFKFGSQSIYGGLFFCRCIGCTYRQMRECINTEMHRKCDWKRCCFPCCVEDRVIISRRPHRTECENNRINVIKYWTVLIKFHSVREVNI